MSVETSQIRLEVPRSLKALCANLAQVNNTNLQNWITDTLVDQCLKEAEESGDPAFKEWAIRCEADFIELVEIQP